VMRCFVASVLLRFQCTQLIAQQTLTAQAAESAKVELGSRTAKDGFRNKDEIRDKFNQWTSGEVQITKTGNLKIGHITMQRKGGDNGRLTANMLQFKMNPVELFETAASQSL